MADKDKTRKEPVGSGGVDPYRDWPYASAYLLDTLDPDLIESHGRHLLCRALNIGRTVAFVGAGVPMAYGRVSWAGLVEAQVRAVLREYEDAPGEVRGAEHVMRLKSVLTSLRSPEGLDVKADRYPMMFQLCQQLSDAIRSEKAKWPVTIGSGTAKRLVNGDASARLDNVEEDPESSGPPRSTVHQQAMNLTIDDRGHASMILRHALQRAFDAVLKAQTATKSENAAEANKKIADYLERFNFQNPSGRAGHGSLEVAHYLTRKRLLEATEVVENEPACDASGGACIELYKAVADHIRKDPSTFAKTANGSRKRYLAGPVRPTRRYLFGTIIDCTRVNPNVVIPRSGRIDAGKLKAPFSGFEPPSATAAAAAAGQRSSQSRQALTPPNRDPLLLLLERLQISRYVTTNYDHEIERLFADRRYQGDHPPTPHPGPAALMRPRQDVIIFDKSKIGELMAFAARDRGRTGAVVHLHGRAEPPGKNGDIVVTEADYQARYLTPDPNRDLVDAAVAMTFGGNPMLFVGSNMGEDDILRPLRQFMSAPSKVGDRVAVALVPAMEERRRRIEDKIAHLGRYGVYTIHFGAASMGGDRDDHRKTATIEADWLPWVWSVKKKLESAFRTISIEAGASKDDSEFDEFLRRHWTDTFASIDGSFGEGPEWASKSPSVDDYKDKSRSFGTDETKYRIDFLKERDGARYFVAPTYVEGVNCEPGTELDLSFDIAILNACLTAARELAKRTTRRSGAGDKLERPPLVDYGRIAEGLASALDGVGNSLLSLLTSARLLRARWDWDEWKLAWFKPPTVREPQFTEKRLPLPDGREIHVEYRHQISRGERPSREAEGRFYDGSPAQAFLTLLDTLKNTEGDEATRAFVERQGRRTLLLAGRRGVGKGHFFNALESMNAAPRRPAPLAAFLTALGNGEPQRYGAAAFYNLSFAHEVMSVFDGLSNLLCHELWEDEGLHAIRRSFHGKRVEKLEAILDRWKMRDPEKLGDPSELSHPVKLGRRAFVAVNALDVLFDHKGMAKNGQVKQLFELMIDPRFDRAPIDFLFVCRDHKLPARLLHGATGKWPTPLPRPTITPEESAAQHDQFVRLGAALAKSAEARTGQRVQLDWRRPSEPRRPEPWESLQLDVSRMAAAPRDSDPSVAVHVLHATRATTFVLAYYPRVALLLARQVLAREAGAPETPRPADDTFPKGALSEAADVGLRVAVRKYLSENSASGLGTARVFAPKILLPAATVLLWRVLETQASNQAQPGVKVAGPSAARLLSRILERLREASRASVGSQAGRAKVDLDLLHRAFEPSKLNEVGDGPLASLQGEAESLAAAIETYDKESAALHEALGGGRMLLTILMASANEIALPVRGDEVGRIGSAARDIERYIERARLALSPVSVKRRPEVLIDYVMAAYRRHHEQHKLSPSTNKPSTVEELDLMLEVIWHLSVIGQPVESDILAWCPRVRTAAESVRSIRTPRRRTGSDAGGARRFEEDVADLVREALTLALSRALVFRLTSEGGVEKDESGTLPAAQARGEEPPGVLETPASDGGSKEPPRHRYAVHRLIQRSVFEKMSAGSSEFSDFDQFTLTLYATQPDDMPKLTLRAHREIGELIESLSGYPGDGGDASKFQAAGTQAPNTERRERLLRAALGVMRSVYSMAVLARFTRSDQARAERREGFFEEHRRRVRWLIKAASNLDDEVAEAERRRREEKRRSQPSADGAATQAVPCGLQAQPDAKRSSPPFYAEEVVWLYNECAVLSLVQGRLSDAQALIAAALTAARKIEPEGAGALHVRLRLNKAVVDIERGLGEEARGYLEAIAEMVGEHAVPPLIATGYLGLIAHLAGETDLAKRRYRKAIDGLRDLRRSRAASIFSRHYGDLLRSLRSEEDAARAALEDARHFADAGGHEDVHAHAMLSQVKLAIGGQAPQRAQLHRMLDAVESYGRDVGMPRLLCEVNTLRARLLLDQGETRLAASLAAEALELASTNDMRLLKIRALIVLARISRARGGNAISGPLERTVEAFARSSNQFAALSATQVRT